MLNSELLSSAEAASRLNVDRATFNRWVTAGRITPAFKMPGLTGGRLFNPEDVEKLREERAEAGAA